MVIIEGRVKPVSLRPPVGFSLTYRFPRSLCAEGEAREFPSLQLRGRAGGQGSGWGELVWAGGPPSPAAAKPVGFLPALLPAQACLPCPVAFGD